VVHPTSDEDGRDNREASAGLECSLLGYLWLRSMASMAWEVLIWVHWEENIRYPIQSTRRSSVRRSRLARSRMIRGGHRVAGTCPCETSGVARFSYVHLSIRCSGRSCASIRVGGVDYAPCGHQTPSGNQPYRMGRIPSSSAE